MRRTGTNWLSNLLKINFGVTFKNNGNLEDIKHKHTLKHTTHNDITSFDQAVISDGLKPNYIIQVKHPYSWFISMTKWIKKLNKPKCDPYKLAHDYNIFYRSWVKFEKQDNERVTIIKYEDLLQSFSKQLDILKNKYNLKNKSNTYIGGNLVVPQSGRFTQENRKWYLEADYHKHPLITDEVKKAFKDNIDENLLKHFQYTLQ